MSTDRIAIWDTMNGRVLWWLNGASSYSWSCGLNDEEGSITVETTTALLSNFYTYPWRRSLAIVDHAGNVLAAGPIYKRDVDFGAGTVTVTAGGLWSLLKKRVYQPSGQPILKDNTHYKIASDGSRTDWQRTFTGSLGGIALRLIKDQCSDLPGISGWTVLAGTHKRVYDGLELQTVADYVAALFDDTKPPVIRFDATLTNGYISWNCRLIGENTQPSTYAISLDANAGVATEWKVTDDAGTATNRAWLVSQLEKEKAASSDKDVPDYSMYSQQVRALQESEPRLDTVDSSHRDVSNGDTLDSYARAIANSMPYQAFNVTIARHVRTANGTSEIAEKIRPGDYCVMTTSRGFWGASTFAGRVESISGDAETLSISVERVTRFDGIDTNVNVSANTDVVQMSKNDAAQQLKNFAAFTRRANNPIGAGA